MLIRPSEIEIHTRAQDLFEHDNPGRLWRIPAGMKADAADTQVFASLIERQNYLTHVRVLMRAEGIVSDAAEENPPQLAPGG